MNLSKELLGKWTLLVDTPNLGMKFYEGGKFIHRDGRDGVYRLSSDGKLEWAWIFDGKIGPYDSTKWQVELNANNPSKKTMNLRM